MRLPPFSRATDDNYPRAPVTLISPGDRVQQRNTQATVCAVVKIQEDKIAA
jgi:hypothetical protein